MTAKGAQAACLRVVISLSAKILSRVRAHCRQAAGAPVMNSIEHLRELYRYNDWSNRRIIIALKSAPSEKALKILAHLLITEKEYYARLFGKNSTGFDFWQDLELEDCSRLTLENAENFENLLRRFDDEGLGQTVNYKTSQGVPVKNDFREMLAHVLFHSASHRGQVNHAIRESGFEPPATDYIIYLRETSDRRL